MLRARVSIILATAATLAAGSTRAAAPLLVAVEVTPGAAGDPAEVRRVVRDELHVPVVAPAGRTAADAPEAMVVALEERRIVVSFRAGPGRSLSRAMAAPSDPGKRLQAIAWLAGNLARDQLSGLMASRMLTAPAALHAAVLSDERSRESPHVDDDARAEHLERHADAGPLTHAPEATIRAPVAPEPLRVSEAAESPGAPAWSVTLAGGTATTLFPWGEGNVSAPERWHVQSYAGVGWQIEAQHRPRDDGAGFGAAVDVGPGEGHLLGAAGLLSWQRERGRSFVGATVGVGVELGAIRVANKTESQSTATGYAETVTVSTATRPGVYGRAAVLAGTRLSSSFDLLAQITVHPTTLGVNDSFVVLTLGLRLRIP